MAYDLVEEVRAAVVVVAATAQARYAEVVVAAVVGRERVVGC